MYAWLIVSIIGAASLLLPGAVNSSFGAHIPAASQTQNDSLPAGMAIPNFAVAAVGDWGCNTNTMATIDNIESKAPDVVLALGDLSYSSTFDCWLEEIAPLEPKMHVVIGNHDGGATDNPTAIKNLPALLERFMLTNQYYSFDYQNVHFTVISTELAYAVGSDQYNFIERDLEEASANYKIDWKVVAFHKPAYVSPGAHGPLTSLRDVIHPLLDKYHVDFVLQGHVHNYQRSFPLTYDLANPSHPIVTTFERSTYDNGYMGEIWIVAGTAGASPHTLVRQDAFIASQYEDTFGFLNLEFSANGSVVTVRFYSNGGRVLDSFEVKKPIEKESSISLAVDGKDYPINYRIFHADLQNVTLDKGTKSLDIFLGGNHETGKLEITLDRTLVDAKSKSGADVQYTVLIDDINANFTETSQSENARSLAIPFDANAKQVKIIGTQIVPEFESPLLLVFFALTVAVVFVHIARIRILPSRDGVQF